MEAHPLGKIPYVWKKASWAGSGKLVAPKTKADGVTRRDSLSKEIETLQRLRNCRLQRPLSPDGWRWNSREYDAPDAEDIEFREEAASACKRFHPELNGWPEDAIGIAFQAYCGEREHMDRYIPSERDPSFLLYLYVNEFLLGENQDYFLNLTRNEELALEEICRNWLGDPLPHANPNFGR